MSWFGNQPMKPSTPLPASDEPEAAPIPLPKMSAEREAAITKAIAERKARTVAHALFLHGAGVLDLPK